MLPVLRPALSVSPEYAETYFANRLHADAWISASEADKEKALSWSAAVIENACVWNEGAWTEEGWHEAVRYAVCEEALWLLKVDPTEYPAFCRPTRTTKSRRSRIWRIC